VQALSSAFLWLDPPTSARAPLGSTTANPLTTTPSTSSWSVQCPNETSVALGYNVSGYQAPPLGVNGDVAASTANLSLTIVDGRLRAGNNLATYSLLSDEGERQSCNFTIQASLT
jgi:hypothetical protein